MQHAWLGHGHSVTFTSGLAPAEKAPPGLVQTLTFIHERQSAVIVAGFARGPFGSLRSGRRRLEQKETCPSQQFAGEGAERQVHFQKFLNENAAGKPICSLSPLFLARWYSANTLACRNPAFPPCGELLTLGPGNRTAQN